MKMKKYELTNEYITYLGKKLYRIKALKNFGNVKIGELGGYIEKEDNLSQDGNAWVFGDAIVKDNAMVCGDAMVYGDARVCGDARVYGDALVCSEAIVKDNAMVYGEAIVKGNAIVGGNARVCGDAIVKDNAWVKDNADYLNISSLDSYNSYITFAKSRDNTILVHCDWFSGNIEEFEKRVLETISNNEQAKLYTFAIEMAKTRIKLE